MIIPEKALAQHIAILGKAGSGKTYAAKGVVEALLDGGSRVCIIDPTGVWHGLRSSASGKSAGYPAVIFGGSHADLPLGAAHGEALAEIIGTSSTPAILDTSQMKVSERTRFFADFADALIRKNRGPLHVFIDEAHLFAPQGKVNDPQSGAMLHAANNLVSLGRARGLRVTMITQRPAKLHKDSLTQIETLVAMRLIAPQDRKAVEEWIKDNADQAKAREIITSLATLKTGHAWIWAPEIGVLERVQFPRIKTFDSSKAPDDDSDGKGPVLAPIDREAIAAKLQTVAADALANDPAVLKKRIRELEAQGKAKEAAGPAFSKEHFNQACDRADQEGFERGCAAGVEAQRTLMAQIRMEFEALSTGFMSALKKLEPIQPKALPPRPVPVRSVPVKTQVVTREKPAQQTDGEVSPSSRKILDVIHRAYPVSLSFDAAARRAVISSKSSAYRKYRAEVEGSIEVELMDGRFRSRPEYAGKAAVSSVAPLDEWVSKLPPAYGNMLRAIHDHGPIDKEEVANLSGVSPTSSGLGSGLRELASLQLIVAEAGRYTLADGIET